MTRLPDWEERLHAYLASVADTPHAFGEHDCALHSANAVLAVIGVDPAAAYRGRYRSVAGSLRALKRYGAGTLEATIDAAFEEKPAAFARRGDLALIDGPLGVSVGVVVGRDALFVGEAGLERFPARAVAPLLGGRLMAKALGTVLKVGAVVAGVAAVVATGGAALGVFAAGALGVSAGTLFLVSAGLSLAGSLLAPKPKEPQVSPATSDRLQASVVLRTPRTMALGHTAMATDIRDQELSTDQAYLHRFIVCASHRVQSIEELWLDDKQAWTSAGGVTAAFSGYLDVTAVLEGSAANAINIGARMGSSRRYTGCAYLYLKFRLTGKDSKATSPFASAVPSRTTIIGKGIAVYDPRLDSTVGGSGAQRANDQTTWAWNDSASRNPALQLLTYLLGWRIQNPVTSAWKLAVGKGIPPARIDLASFIDAANLCDETVATSAGGTEPRYRSDGIFSEGDDLSVVFDGFKSTMNATLDDADGKIRVNVLHNDLASPIGALTADDVLGDFTWTQTPPLSDSFNVVRGGYTDPSTTSLYQLVDYPEVSIASPDGIERVTTVNLPLVQSPSQAQRLAKMRLQRALYGGTFAATFGAGAWRFQKGDVIQVTFPALGWIAKLFRIADMTINIDGTVPMTLREEAAAIYAWDASDAAAVVGAAPTSYTPSLSPLVQAIGEASGPNLLPAPSDPATWTLGNGAAVAYPTTGRARAQLYTAGAYNFWGPAVECREGVPLFCRCFMQSDHGGTETVNASAVWTDSTGTDTATNLSSLTATSLTDAAAGKTVDFKIVPPAGAVKARLYTERPAATGWSMYVDQFWISEVQLAADVTAQAQIVVTPPATAVIGCDYLGNPLTHELPRLVGFKVTKGGVSITSDPSVSYADTYTNITKDTSVSPAAGSFQISAIGANEGYLDVVVTVAGVASPSQRVVFQKQLAQPPATGGAGSKRAYDTTLDTISGTSAVRISDLLTVTLGPSESLYGSGSPDYYLNGSGGSRTASVYWAYSTDGGSTFTAFASAITGSAATGSHTSGGEYIDGNPGSVNTAQSKSGLAARDYTVALFASLNASGRDVSWDTNGGSVLVEAKV